MKKFTLIGGIIFLSLTVITWIIAALFKIMHWPGAGLLFIVSTSMGVVGVILITIHIIKYRINGI